MSYPASPPLQGLRVVELAGVLAGPSVGCFLAELGAEVLKIEPPETGDLTRAWYLAGEDRSQPSAYFSTINWGKQSVALDLASALGRAVLARLLPTTDVLLTNFKPGSADKLGLAYHQLQDAYPSLIYGAITGYGPDNDRAGFDAIVQAESGFMHLNRTPGGRPAKMPVALMDLLAAHQLKEAILAALLHRGRTGRGCQVHTSLIEAGVSALANQLAAWLWAGQPPEPMGSDHPSIVPYGSLFAARGGEPLMLAVGSDAQFAAMASLLGRPDWATDPRFATNPARVQHRDVLKEALQQAIQAWQIDPLMEALAARKIPAGRILRVEESAALPEVRHLLLHHPLAPGQGFRTAAFRSSAWAAVPLLPPPALGQDTAAVLAALGFDDYEIASLKNAG
ncbi:MAG: CoA transferase [Bacteroidetes bacterium]|jgi:crotonobetainyl-CoA:carnitine CoA-transferase CaiB-like acyl-CoA transferase|nr:CoA transferase [Bacteroidota bacterium]